MKCSLMQPGIMASERCGWCREEQERKLQEIEDRRNAIAARRVAKRTQLAPEPAAPVDGEDTPVTTLIRVRLPHGGSAQRRFPEDVGLTAVYDWVDSLEELGRVGVCADKHVPAAGVCPR